MAKRMKHCAWCGEDLGEAFDNEPESCGAPTCNREVRGMQEEARQDAHDQLDRDLGWN